MKAHVKLLALLCILGILAIPFVTVSAQPAPATPAAGKVIPKGPIVVDNPIIQSFNLTPAVVVQGDLVSLNWQVSPGPGRSPITATTVTVDGGNFASSSNLTHVFSRTFPWVGEKTFVLTVRNAEGKTTTQSKTVRGVSLVEAMSKVTIANMEANPQRFSTGQPIDFTVIISNANPGLFLKPVNIFITQGSRVVGNRTNLNLGPGNQSITLQDSGFTATGGVYVVDVEYRGQHKTRNFVTKSVPMYTLDPANP